MASVDDEFSQSYQSDQEADFQQESFIPGDDTENEQEQEFDDEDKENNENMNQDHDPIDLDEEENEEDPSRIEQVVEPESEQPAPQAPARINRNKPIQIDFITPAELKRRERERVYDITLISTNTPAYEPLLDEYLQDYFCIPSINQHLKQIGLIDDNGNVLTNIQVKYEQLRLDKIEREHFFRRKAQFRDYDRHLEVQVRSFLDHPPTIRKLKPHNAGKNTPEWLAKYPASMHRTVKLYTKKPKENEKKKPKPAVHKVEKKQKEDKAAYLKHDKTTQHEINLFLAKNYSSITWSETEKQLFCQIKKLGGDITQVIEPIAAKKSGKQSMNFKKKIRPKSARPTRNSDFPIGTAFSDFGDSELSDGELSMNQQEDHSEENIGHASSIPENQAVDHTPDVPSSQRSSQTKQARFSNASLKRASVESSHQRTQSNSNIPQSLRNSQHSVQQNSVHSIPQTTAEAEVPVPSMNRSTASIHSLAKSISNRNSQALQNRASVASVKNSQVDIQKSQARIQKSQASVHQSQASVHQSQASIQNSQANLQKSQASIQKSQASIQKSQASIQKSQPKLNSQPVSNVVSQNNSQANLASSQVDLPAQDNVISSQPALDQDNSDAIASNYSSQDNLASNESPSQPEDENLVSSHQGSQANISQVGSKNGSQAKLISSLSISKQGSQSNVANTTGSKSNLVSGSQANSQTLAKGSQVLLSKQASLKSHHSQSQSNVNENIPTQQSNSQKPSRNASQISLNQKPPSKSASQILKTSSSQLLSGKSQHSLMLAANSKSSLQQAQNIYGSKKSSLKGSRPTSIHSIQKTASIHSRKTTASNQSINLGNQQIDIVQNQKEEVSVVGEEETAFVPEQVEETQVLTEGVLA